MENKRERSIRKALQAIASLQRKDGGFDNVFHTSLILLALREAREHRAAADIIERGCRFILNEKSAGFTWNYWRRDSDETRAKPYPDDLDDTACAGAVLSEYMPEAVDGAALAGVTQALIAAEESPGGPYQTWLVPRSARGRWHDIDPVVNANIGSFLGMHGVNLPNLQNLCVDCVERGSYASKYYASPIIALYFLSRFMGGPRAQAGRLSPELCEKAQDHIRTHMKAVPAATVLETACGLIALRNLNVKSDSGRDAARTETAGFARLEKVCNEGSWKADPIYIEEARGSVIYSGSPALTAALCVEALASRRDHDPSASLRDTLGVMTPKSEAVHEDIIAKATERYKNFSLRQTQAVEKYIRMLTAGDPARQITLLPYHFEKALGPKAKNARDNPLKDDSRSPLTTELGAANLFGWIAYRVYDDILDDEGEPEHIPLANVALREVSTIYASLLPASAHEIFKTIMDQIDGANAWERHMTRFERKAGDKPKILSLKSLPDYKNLDVIAEKSIGHALGPISLLIRRGYASDSPEVRGTIAFFKHFLIARQLNDDAHDWQRDLERGFLNPASVRLLSQWKEKNDESEVDLDHDISELRALFWDRTIRDVAAAVRFHVDKARSSLDTNRAIKDRTYLDSLLAPLESAAKKALADRERMIGFLRAYSG